MARYVVDSSATIEYLLDTDIGRQLIPIFDSADLAAPELLDIEVVSTLRRWVLNQMLSVERADALLQDLAVWPIERISHRFLAYTAWQHRHNLSAYDATYVAAAALIDATLVTADGRLARAPRLGVPVLFFQTG